MAEVHLARVLGAAGFEKLVVVKRLLPALAEESDYVAQFIDEARLAATFSHANIVSTFDFGEADGSYYIAMEYVEGKNLRRIQDVLERRGKKLPAPAAIHIVAEACRGLDYAHTRKDAAGNPLKVVHRDVSPQNVVVSYSGDVKVLDFGIAKSSAREFKTQAGIVKGKLRYMSPEQVAGEEIDGRSDAFAAAVILWELFFGKRWMPDLPDEQLVHWVKKGEFVLPPTAPKPPDDLKALLDKALAVDRDQRYPTAGDFAKALARYNSQRWPDFSATDLSRLLEAEFGEDMRRERAWIAGILGGLKDGAARVNVKVTTNPGFMPPAESFSTNPEAPTLLQTPSAGTNSKISSGELPLVKGNTSTGPRMPTPSKSGSVAVKPAIPPPTAQELLDEPSTVVQEKPQLPEAPTAKSRRWLYVGGAALFAVLGTVLGVAVFHSTALPTPTPTPIAKASPVVTASAPAASPLPSATATTTAIAATSPAVTVAPTATPPATHVPTATPVRTQVVVVHTPTPFATPRRTPPPTPTPAVVAAANARVSVSVPLPGWAEVWIDGKQVKAETPLINFPIAAGPHEIAVVKNGKKSSQHVTLHPGENPPIVLPVPQ